MRKSKKDNDKQKNPPDKKSPDEKLPKEKVVKIIFLVCIVFCLILSMGLPLLLHFILPLPAMKWVSSSFQTSDWLSFWATWIPSFLALFLTLWSIYLTAKIAKKQEEDSKMASNFQANLTLALDLPDIIISRINFFFSEEIEDTVLRYLYEDKWGTGTFRFVIFLGNDSLPIDYQINLNYITFMFNESSQYSLSSNYIFKIVHGKPKRMIIDLNIPEGEPLFEDLARAYYYPTCRPLWEGKLKLILHLSIKNMLIKSFNNQKNTNDYCTNYLLTCNTNIDSNYQKDNEFRYSKLNIIDYFLEFNKSEATINANKKTI